jgi:DNA/RNA endonuclease G (NUC1)
VSCWDARTRNPRWVAEKLTRASVSGAGDRKSVAFSEDAALPPRFRARLDDYRASGYDRGHLAAAANHKGSQSALSGTFTLSNVSPQAGRGFNRDYWARLEKFVRDLTKRYEEVYVVTGPLFLPRPAPGASLAAAASGAAPWLAAWPFIGRPPHLVGVPTHFYKVVYARGGAAGVQGAALGAFILPNEPLPAGEPLSRFAVPLEALEAAAGLTFYEGVLGKERDAAREAFAAQERAWRAALPPSHAAVARAPLLLPPAPAPPAATQQQPLLLPPPQKAPLLLEAPPAQHAAAASTNALAKVQPAPSASAQPHAAPADEHVPQVSLPRRAGVPSPLCAVEACRLPAESFWTANGSGGSAKESAANGNGCGGDE